MQDCQWPALPEHYDKALRATINYILDNFDVHGIVVSGSIIRGNPNASSDFDTVVIHAKPERQRVQKFFHGVPAEIFVNPPAAIRSYFQDERKSGKPSTAHMLTTGFVLLDRDPIVQRLIQEAKDALAQSPGLSAQALTFKRYGAADLYENAVDIVESNPANASFILHDAVHQMLEYHFFESDQWLPRLKETLDTLDRTNPELGQLAYRFYNETGIAEKVQIAELLAEKILGETGFFQWETSPEEYA